MKFVTFYFTTFEKREITIIFVFTLNNYYQEIIRTWTD